MADGKKYRWTLDTTVVADTSTPQNPYCGTGLRFSIDTMDQGFPKCFPMPGMTLRIDAAKKIGPAAGMSPARGTVLKRSAAPARKGTSKRAR